jgi:hypothetical protein
MLQWQAGIRQDTAQISKDYLENTSIFICLVNLFKSHEGLKAIYVNTGNHHRSKISAELMMNHIIATCAKHH